VHAVASSDTANVGDFFIYLRILCGKPLGDLPTSRARHKKEEPTYFGGSDGSLGGKEIRCAYLSSTALNSKSPASHSWTVQHQTCQRRSPVKTPSTHLHSQVGESTRTSSGYISGSVYMRLEILGWRFADQGSPIPCDIVPVAPFLTGDMIGNRSVLNPYSPALVPAHARPNLALSHGGSLTILSLFVCRFEARSQKLKCQLLVSILGAFAFGTHSQTCGLMLDDSHGFNLVFVLATRT
jgi:hypothetical protein